MRPENPKQNERVTALYEAILRLNTLDECIQFFDDLCAVTELRTLEQRYAVAGCLLQGKVYSEIRRETGESHGVVTRVARELGVGSESLRGWVQRAEIDSGKRPGTSTADAQRITQLEKENRELRRANDILKAASVFVATELDGRPRR